MSAQSTIAAARASGEARDNHARLRMHRFDKSTLTPADRALLTRFRNRRQAFDAFLATDNVIHHRHTCPACGFPALTDGEFYETCLVCLWEDCGFDDKQDAWVGAPNYISLIAYRLIIARALEALLATHTIAASMDHAVRAIKHYGQMVDVGEVVIGADHFERIARAALQLEPA